MKTKLLAGAMAIALIGCSEKNSESLRESPSYDMAPIDASEAIPT